MNNRISLEMSGVQYASQGEMQELVMKFNKSTTVPSSNFVGEAITIETGTPTPMTWGDVARNTAASAAGAAVFLGGLAAALRIIRGPREAAPAPAPSAPVDVTVVPAPAPSAPVDVTVVPAPAAPEAPAVPDAPKA
jgi:hypothetical protein